MKRILNNLTSFENFMNMFLSGVFLVFIKTLNGVQYMKMAYYKMRGIPCYMITDHKFGEKICYKKVDK